MRGSRLRYRPVQAVAVATLAALITACATFAPLYDRAMRQALTDLAVDSAPIPVSGLQIHAIYPAGAGFGGITIQRPTSPEGLAAALPDDVRPSYGKPILGYSGTATRDPGGSTDPRGEIVWREGQCEHVEIVTGSCPSAAGQILVSEKDVEGFGLAVGTRFSVPGMPIEGAVRVHPTSVRLVVSGVYRQVPGDYWFGTTLTGRSGLVDPAPPPHPAHDVWLTDRATFTDGEILQSMASTVDLPLNTSEIGVDDLLTLGGRLHRFAAEQSTGDGRMEVSVRTGLTDIAEQVRSQIDQSRVTVPVLMAQLGLLGVVVLWLVLAAVTEQRRPEAALARLRGRGRRGARRLLIGELLPPALAGVVPGALAAVAAAWAARTLVLPGHAPFELGTGFVLALLLAVVVLVAVTVLAASRVAKEPVETLLRRVPVRRPGWALGALEALVVAGAGSIVVVFLAGGLEGPAALVAPGLLAVVVGLVLAHVTSPSAALLGRRLLERGRVRAGVSALDAARSPATRRAVAIVTIATALAAFSADALVVGERNRASAAEQEAGAPVVLALDGTDLAGVQAALRTADPTGERATTVVRVRAPAPDAPEVVAVEPDRFRRIALFPGGAAPASAWDRVVPPPAQPTTLRGGTLVADLTSTSLDTRRLGGGDAEVTLSADVAGPGGQITTVTLGRVDAAAGPHRMRAPMPCDVGCELTALRLSTLPGAKLVGSLTLARVRGRGPVPLGPATKWRPLRDRSEGSVVPRSDDGSGLTLQVEGLGASTLVLTHRWVPDRLAVLATADDTAAGRDGAQVLGLDGEEHPARLVGRLPRVPGSPPDSVVVDLDSASRAVTLASGARIEIWLGTVDPALRAAITRALRDRDIAVAETRTLAETRRRYDESAAAWSLQLAGVVGGAALAIAVVVLLVGAAGGWRIRARDLAALRMSGVGSRSVAAMALAAQLPAVVVGVAVGTVAGVVGAQVAMPTFPLFAEPPEVSTLDLQPAWWAIALAAAASLLVLGVTAVLLGRATGRRADLRRLRESL